MRVKALAVFLTACALTSTSMLTALVILVGYPQGPSDGAAYLSNAASAIVFTVTAALLWRANRTRRH